MFRRHCLIRVYCQDQEHIVGRATAEDVFSLLPKEGEFQQFGEVRADEGGTTDYTAGDVAPVGTVQSVGNSSASGSHA